MGRNTQKLSLKVMRRETQKRDVAIDSFLSSGFNFGKARMDEELLLFCFATLLVLVGMRRRKGRLPEKDIKEERSIIFFVKESPNLHFNPRL